MALSFNPPSYESAYYDGLFNIADQKKTGVLAGSEAVQFLSRSKIPTQTLKNIWNMADQNPKTNYLDKNKFNVAVRLIQMFQNGERPQGANLNFPENLPMKPPHFEGVSGVMVPLPNPPSQTSNGALPMQQYPEQTPAVTPQQQQQQQQQQMAVNLTQGGENAPGPQIQPSQATSLTLHQDQYVMLPHEQSRYEALFPNYEKLKDGFVYGNEAVALFSRSGLSKDQLREIWNLADDPVDNRLDKLEFAIAMHLIVCISKKNLDLPRVLPSSLKALKVPIPSSEISYDTSAQLGGLPPPPSNISQPVQANHGQGVSTQAAVSEDKQSEGLLSISDAFSDIPAAQPPAPSQPEQTRSANSLSSPSETIPTLSTPTLLQTHTLQPETQTLSNAMFTPAPSMPQTQTLQPDIQLQPNLMPVSVPAVQQSQILSMDTQVLSNQIPPPAPSLQRTQTSYPDTNILSPNGTPALQSQDERPMSIPNPSEIAQGSMNDKQPASTTAYAYEEEVVSDSDKLKKVLQQLQAENISLKAQLSTFSQEEIDVQNDITATANEIGTLSKELVSLRSEVAKAKASLIEKTSELKAKREKKSDINDLITETKETLEVLNIAYESFEDVQKFNIKEEAAAPKQNDMDLFGGFDPSPVVPQNDEHTLNPPTNTNEMQQHIMNEMQNHPILPNTTTGMNDGFQNNQEAMQMGEQNLTNMQEPIPHDQHQVALGGFAGGDQNGLSAQQPLPHMQPMGGTPVAEMRNPVINPNAFGHMSRNQVVTAPPTTQEVSQMHQEALRAADIAAKAEQEEQFGILRAEELKRAANEAQTEIREMQLAMNKKKKRGGKKVQKKEYEAAFQKASELKREADEAHSKITGLQVNAMKAKREADQLRQISEQAEFDIAAAASVRQMQDVARSNGNIGYTNANNQTNAMGISSQVNYMQNNVPTGDTQGFDNPFLSNEFGTTPSTAGQF